MEYVREFITEHSYAPSYREIGEAFLLSSVATVAEHINTLRSKGYLNVDPGEARSIQLNPITNTQTFSIPLAGTIAAGGPIEAIQTQETIDIPQDMMSDGVFALKVRGDSMKEDGILDGDHVIIEPCNNPKNGDVVVALLNRENATLKRFYKEGDHIRLQPANSAYSPIRTRRVTIQGKVKGIIRKFV